LSDPLVERREQAMDRADRALDKAWPKREGPDYVRDMESAARELEEIAIEMKASSLEPVEQTRTYRYLGGVYSDLAPALGKELLLKARDAYRNAEALLEGHADALERARLDFNFGNTLRQLDPNDAEQLREAERRLLAARSVFVAQAPQHVTRVDEALASVRNLLKIAPLAKRVERDLTDMRELEQQLATGEDVAAVGAEMRQVMEREGGIPELLAAVGRILDELPDSAKQGGKDAEIKEQLAALASGGAGTGGSPGERNAKLLELLKARLRAEAKKGTVTPDRERTLADLLEDFGKAMASGTDDLRSLMARVDQMRAKAEAQVSSTHYLSHGIERPPQGSRAAELVELCWALRSFLVEELNRPGKSSGESKAMGDLLVRASGVDRRIYEAGSDDARAVIVDREALRPLTLEIRSLAARHHPLLARPIWPGARLPVATDAVFYSGSRSVRERVVEACRVSGLELATAPRGHNIASGRWEQLQNAFIGVFDLGTPVGPEQAAVAYELGIALTLGKPVVVLAREGQTIPFNIDVDPVQLSGNAEDATKIREAVDRSLVWTMPRPRSTAFLNTIEHVRSRYPVPQADTYVNETLKEIDRLCAAPDLTALTAALKALVQFLGNEGPMLLHPIWPPVYQEPGRRTLFHVMPFGPPWGDAVAGRVEQVCKRARVRYVRGDRVEEPNVIRSIWDEINRASHVLVDLTGFNANVALELGIAHTVGRPCRMVGQGDTVERLFPMIAKDRFHPYHAAVASQLDALVEEFVAPKRAS